MNAENSPSAPSGNNGHFLEGFIPKIDINPQAATEYLTDAWQRSVLFTDVLRQRGNQYEEMISRKIATVLSFQHEIVLSGQSLARPINFSLAKILPAAHQTIDPTKRPLVVIDPRAGQGPGIGGFNTLSEIGDALDQHHPVYFIGFASEPTDSQTFLDVVEGHVSFLDYIVQQHPDAPKPFAFGNCQAGYQTLMVAALKPEAFGPIIVAGSPISFWQGVRGKNPMRYAGGLLGGSWMTQFISDLSGGKFDGSWLILNFDVLNPANWLWDKQYKLYANVDSEAQRYLGFERWWGDFIKFNGGEIQWLVDELFIGNKLTKNALHANDGRTINLRNIRSPIVVLTSEGDNISPPQQTLGWILDLYKDVNDLQIHGQTVVYCVNPKVGHLAIFVSPKIGAKEDEEFVRLINEIDLLPPGLYELIIEEATPAAEGACRWHSKFELRTFDDLRAYGRNSTADDRAFEAVRRVSELNHAAYNTFISPWIKACVTPMTAQAMFDYNPLRLSYSWFADSNPWMSGVQQLADWARRQRLPAQDDNTFLALQNQLSGQISQALDQVRKVRDKGSENLFFSLYSAPWLQAALGMDSHADARPAVTGLTPEEHERLVARIAELEASIDQGGYAHALIRAVLYVLLAERSFEDSVLVALNKVRNHIEIPANETFRTLVRDQYYLLLLKRQSAIPPLASMVKAPAQRKMLLEKLRQIVAADTVLTPEQQNRLAEVNTLLALPVTSRSNKEQSASLPAAKAAH